MQGYKSKENIKKKRKISKVFKCLVFHLILLAFCLSMREFLAIRTNLNSVQQAHVLYSWAIRIILCSCAIRTCLNFLQYTPIWISCNKHTSFIHGQYAPSFVHVQYAPVWILCTTHQSEFRATSTHPLFMGNTHHPLFMCNTHQSEFRTIRINPNLCAVRTSPYSHAI